MKNKKYFLIIGLAVLMASTYFVSENKRKLASTDDPTMLASNEEIKKTMIQSLLWKKENDVVRFEITSSNIKMCQDWSQLTITLVADGLAVSGEPPRVSQSANCDETNFVIMWPQSPKKWTEKMKKTGDFSEMPQQFYVEKIELSGPRGQMKISSYEINALWNQDFILKIEE